jgi:cell wall-associated NlpC family hydrolase
VNQRSTLIAAALSMSALMGIVLGIVILGGGSTAATTPNLKPGTVPEEYRPWVLRAGSMCPEVPAPTIAAQIDAESSWNSVAASRTGALGIAQFMPDTWSSWGHDEDGNHDGPPENPDQGSPLDPFDAIVAQGRYMCALAQQMLRALADHAVTGDVLDLALASYNAGAGAVLAAHGIPHNGETEIYVPRIRALMAKYTALDPPVGGGGAIGARIVAAAQSQTGTPYVWGGGNTAGPTGGGFDCSGLVMYAVYQGTDGAVDLSVEHLADWQARQGQPVTGPAPGAQIDLSLLRPGDVIGFADSPGARYHHIGIYAGQGQLTHAPDFGETVKTAPLTTPYWAHQIWIVRRFG